jgi:exoribonuclease R
MSEGGRLAAKAERACVDLVEAALLKDRVGEAFDGCVVELEEHRPDVGTVQLESPAVIGRIDGEGLALGERLRVRVVASDPETSKVRFVPA